MKCNNCNDMGHVSISVDCPECKGPQGLALLDTAPELLEACEAAFIFTKGVGKLMMKRPERFKLSDFPDLKKLSIGIGKVIKKAEGK